jgi:DNA-3-methyladenine glycosylase
MKSEPQLASLGTDCKQYRRRNRGREHLTRDFYTRGVLTVARELIGMHLVHNDGKTERIGRIVETEAYRGPADLAAHSARGRTARTNVLYGPPGHAYVYLIYGIWNCLNLVTSPEGTPHAVLLRALAPVQNLDEPCWGPGLLCRAMRIDRRLNTEDLCGNTLWLERPGHTAGAPRISRSTRIGVDYAGDWALRPWRFFDRDSPYVSTVSPRRRKSAVTAFARGGSRSEYPCPPSAKKR